jgi:hypothetical protein
MLGCGENQVPIENTNKNESINFSKGIYNGATQTDAESVCDHVVKNVPLPRPSGPTHSNRTVRGNAIVTHICASDASLRMLRDHTA